ncbi:hypothetical protein FHU38_003244 [Saccharomonospora amisosensis]|uniref:HNH nuclease domain-containing protein n=1 Tax=Saccharomonospora amisosensis TaxID=1128677 RepID=A0A7X5URM6_9PSEU|nr:HNH endonuclease signature motif containing protein [Saccharomonospora amisosensis]NIJ12900.1 hypothetical protein [Saccharomonospora amisosensis]
MSDTHSFEATASPEAVAGLADGELLTALRELEVLSRRVYAALLRVIAEIESRGTAQALGYAGAGALLRDVGNHNPGHVRRLLAHTRALHRLHTPSGTRIEAKLPHVAAALGEGELGAEHVEAIRAALEALPSAVSTPDRAITESILCEAATSSEPRIVTKLGREIRARLDPDGDRPAETELTRPDRWLELRPRPDGGVTGMFGLDPEAGALLTALLSPHTAPRVDEQGPDRRDRDERYGDALVDVLHLAARCPEAPSEAGEPVTLPVTTHLSELRQGIGRGLVDGHPNLPVAQLRRMACDCNALPVVLGSRGETLDIGRASRTVPRRIRRALVHRDVGCTFPGCDRKAKWCQAHHIVHWADGGPTALHNLVLVCSAHHRVLHHTDWEVTLINGRPWYLPPSYVDPGRLPRRNTLHTVRAGAGPLPFRPPNDKASCYGGIHEPVHDKKEVALQ